MEVLLDTNFIISCIKRKISFISELEELGFRVIMPREVYQELKDLRSDASKADKDIIDIALKIFESKELKTIALGNKSTDLGLIEKGKKGYYIATLDAALKRAVPNKIVISNSKNSLIIERN